MYRTFDTKSLYRTNGSIIRTTVGRLFHPSTTTGLIQNEKTRRKSCSCHRRYQRPGRRQTELDAAVKEIGENVTGVQSDASLLADLSRLFATIEKEQGHLDVLFANAGGAGIPPLGAITEEQFDKTFNTNVKGLLFTVQKALPLLPSGASIILNASTASSVGTPAFSVYSATKAAVRSFARNWTLDLKEHHIRVNAISPGVVPTPGYNLMGLSDEQVQQFIDSQANKIPLGRVGTPDEIAKAVVFLACDDSSFVNGIELFVDGGMAQI